MEAHCIQALVLSAVFLVAGSNCFSHGCNLVSLLPIAMFIVSLLVATGAAMQRVTPKMFAWYSALIWSSHTFAGLGVALAVDIPKDMFSGWQEVVLLSSWGIVTLVCQVSTCHVLHIAVVCVLTELNAILLWMIACRFHNPWKQLVLTHLIMVVIPTAINLLTRPKHQPTPANSSKQQLQPLEQPSAAGLATTAAAALPTKGESMSSCAGCAGVLDTKTMHKVMVPPAQTIPWAALAKAKYQYRSGNRQNAKVAVKIATCLHADDLMPDALQDLSIAVAAAISQSTGTRVRVVDGAIRNGCIQLSMTAYQLPDDGTCGDSQDALADALAFAQELLPGLLQHLRVRNGVNSGALEPGQYLQAQLGDYCVRATVDKDTLKWAFQLQSSASGGGDGGTGSSSIAQAAPKLCFARPSLLALEATGNHKHRDAALSPPPTSKRFRDAHRVAFDVRVVCGAGGLERPVLVVGTSPADVNAPSDVTGSDGSAEKASWQLWVQCQGQYVETVVGGLALVEGSGTTLQAVAHVPPFLLARHHMPDGPVARLQLLTAELWAGDVLLSSTPLLVDGMQHLQPAAAAAPSGFGWWGAPSVKTAAGFVHEMAVLSEQLQAMPSDEEQVMQSHEDFMTDVATWLSSLQLSAPDTCCDKCMVPSSSAASPTPTSSNTLQLCNAICHNLQAYASACKLPYLKALLRAQEKCIRLAARRDAANSPGSAQTLLQQVKQQLVQAVAALSSTRTCPICDQVYYARLRTYLRQTQSYLSVPFGLANIFTVVLGMDVVHAVASCAWGVFHMLAGLQLTRTEHGADRRFAWLPSAQTFQAAALAAHFSIEVVLSTGLVHFSKDFARPGTLGPYLAAHTTFAVVTEQVAIWGSVPTWLFRLIVLLEMTMHTRNIVWGTTLPVWFGGGAFPLGTVVIPYLLDKYWRRLLMGRRVDDVMAQIQGHVHAD